MKQKTSFLDLPPEIRNTIYELALRLENANNYDYEWYGVRPNQPVLTQTCRQIRLEALPMFYATTRFSGGLCFGWSENWPVEDIGWLRWLKAIGPERSKLLRCLVLYCEWHDNQCDCPLHWSEQKALLAIQQAGIPFAGAFWVEQWPS